MLPSRFRIYPKQSASPEVGLLIVWSNLNHFFVHQPAATNSKFHALAVHPPLHIQRASSEIRISNPVGGLWWSFLAETFYVLRPLAVFAEEIHRWCLTEFYFCLTLLSFFVGCELYIYMFLIIFLIWE